MKVMYCRFCFVLRSSKVLSFNLKNIYIEPCQNESIYAYCNIALRANISYSRVGSQEPLMFPSLVCLG